MKIFFSTAFPVLLFGLSQAIRITAWRRPAYRERLKERNLIAQIRVKEGSGRYFIFNNGTLTSRAGIHTDPDVVVSFKSARLALKIFTRPNDQLGRINAAKSFSMTLDGPQDKALWFMFTLEQLQTIGWKYGVDLGNGEVRYCNMANGGPLICLCQGRQDYSYDADHFRRQAIHSPGVFEAKGQESSRRRVKPRLRTAWTELPSPWCMPPNRMKVPNETRRFRPER